MVGLELKTPVGRQSQEPRAIEADFAAAGASYAVSRTIDDVHGALRAAGVPVHAMPMAASS